MERNSPRSRFGVGRARLLSMAFHIRVLVLLLTSAAALPVSAQQGLITPEVGNWVLPANDYASTRYSPLDQISTSNVGQLKEVWSQNLDPKDGYEGQPIVKDDRMWTIGPYPNTLTAFDISNPRQPKKLWEFTPDQDSTAYGKACCDRVNRGGFWYDGKIIYNGLDNTTWAVDARTGKPVWHKRLGEVEKGETRTMAPILVHKEDLAA